MNQQINYCTAKTCGRLRLKSVCIAILPLAFAVLLLPQSVLAQEENKKPCTIEQGTIGANDLFDKNTPGNDFQITCEGELDSEAIATDTFKTLLDNKEDYSQFSSKVIIDVSGVTSDLEGITIESIAEKLILKGSISSDDEVTDGSVVSVSNGGTGESEDDIDFKSTATIASEGMGRHGIEVISTIGENDDAEVLVVNSGPITTSGDGASGLRAYIELDSATDSSALGLISVTNRNKVTVSGDGTDSEYVTGLQAVYRSKSGSEGLITNGGDVDIKNTGSITVSGNWAKGIYAKTQGTGNVEITVSGTVSAGQQGSSETATSSSNGEANDSAAAVAKKQNFGIGIHAHTDTDQPENASNDTEDTDVTIIVSGAGASIVAYGASSDDEATTNIDESMGIAIWAQTGETGKSHVSITDGARVSAFGGDGKSAGYAVKFEGGTGILDLGSNVIIEGDIFGVTTLN